MATLTAPASARVAAAKRGLAPAMFKAPAQSAPAPLAPLTNVAVCNFCSLPAPAPETAPEPAEPKSPSKKQQKSAEFLAHRRALQMAAREKLLPVLRGVFPQAFPLPPVPLAIGIHHQILEVAGDSIGPADLSAFLGYWTSRRSYLIAVWRGMGRRNLDGSIAGTPTTAERNCAGRGVWRDRHRPIEEPAEEKIEQKVEGAA